MSSSAPAPARRTSTDAREDAARIGAGLRVRLDARVARGWDPRSAGQWYSAITLGFVVAGVLCLVAASDRKLPRGFFQILRWIVFLVCGAGTIGSLRTETLRTRKIWDWVCATVCAGCAVLFNPLAPIHMTRTTWSVLDTVFGIWFLILAVLCLPVSIWYLRYANTRARENSGNTQSNDEAEVLDALSTWERQLEDLERQRREDVLGEEYSLEGMERGFREAKRGAPFTEEEREEVRALHAQLQAAQKALEDHYARRITEAEEQIADLKERRRNLASLERMRGDLGFLEEFERAYEKIRAQDEHEGCVREESEYRSLQGMERAMRAAKGGRSLTELEAAKIAALHALLNPPASPPTSS